MRYLMIALGVVFTAIGLIGIYLPVLPTTPFLLVAAACFARGSETFHKRLVNFPIYKETVEPIQRGEGMSLRKKKKILGIITLLFTICFFLIPVKHARIAIVLVLACHYYIFIRKIPTAVAGHD